MCSLANCLYLWTNVISNKQRGTEMYKKILSAIVLIELLVYCCYEKL